ncbi:MAG: ribosome-associated translation inhibitor RaiA [Planctomycetes bacterium]|nr:ribosome-associated translation inhibitor RaiA [Planctomycetota bacterium]
MDIVITAIHCEVSDSVKEYAKEKISKLDKYFDKARKTHVSIHAEPENNEVELVCVANNNHVFTVQVTAEGSIREAIDLSVDKMSKQLRRYKDKIRGHKGKDKRAKVVKNLQRQMDQLSARIEALDEDETYEDVLDEE